MAIEPRPPAPYPERPVDDHDRHVAIERIQRAIAADDVAFEELDELFERVYAATTLADIAAVTINLPIHDAPKVPAPSHPIARTRYTMFGDIKVGGWISAEGDLNYGTGLGSIYVDLSSADLHRDITVRVRAILGDVTVILPDGVRTNLESFTGLGDTKIAVSDPVPGAPYVRVVAATLLGDARLYTLSQVPEGRLQKLWRALRGR